MAGAAAAASSAPPLGLSARQRGLAFATLMIAFVMDVLDGTIVNIAIPAIRHELAAGDAAIQWMVVGYSVAFAMLLVAGGRLGDIFGYRRLFLLGVGGFTLASLLCGLARNPAELVAARLLQGVAAAGVAPQILSLVQVMYAPYERVRMLSFFGLLGGLTAVLGPIVGGTLIEANPFGLGWRAIFLINVPIGLVGLTAAALLLPQARASDEPRIDWRGTALMILTVFAVVFPLVEGRPLGWPGWLWLLLAAAVPVAALLVRHLHRQVARGAPALAEPALFRERSFAAGLAASLLFSTAGGGFLFVLTLVLQIGLGLDPLSAGLVHIPFAVGVGLGVALLGRKVLPRLGRNVLLAGAGAMALGIAGLWAAIASGAGLAAACVALLIAGLGMGTVAGPLSPIALARVETRHAGTASGTLKTVQQLGTATGTATVGTLFLIAAGGATATTPTRAALAVAAAALIALLLGVMLVSRAFPRRLFDD